MREFGKRTPFSRAPNSPSRGSRLCANHSPQLECMCRGLAGATPQTVREMFSAAMTPARPETAVLAASDDEDLDAEYRAKQPKGPFVSPSQILI